MEGTDPFGKSSGDFESMANWLEDAGLAGPAYLLFQSLKPLSFVGGQGLLFLQPLLPHARWRSAAGHLAEILEDRSRLDNLLAALEVRMSRPDHGRDKENA
jgi:hypothetical protein